MKRKHTECVFDICNYCGHNGGAWADLYGADLIVFGGAWHGDFETDECPTSFMPGEPTFRDAEQRAEYSFTLYDGERCVDAGRINFGVLGDVAALLSRFEADETPMPKDFAGLRLLAMSEVHERAEEQ